MPTQRGRKALAPRKRETDSSRGQDQGRSTRKLDNLSLTRSIPVGGSPSDRNPTVEFRAAEVAGQLARWGFLAHPDLPDGPGPAFLLVAFRPAPTLRHYDPEAVDYWVTEGGRGMRRTLTEKSPTPLSKDFSWGVIRLVDRLGISNEYLTFGGHLNSASVDGHGRRSILVPSAPPPARRPLTGLGCWRGCDRGLLRPDDGGRRLRTRVRSTAWRRLPFHQVRGIRSRH